MRRLVFFLLFCGVASQDLAGIPRFELGTGLIVKEPINGSVTKLHLNSGMGQRLRRKRSWLWNQFFVIEEYRGPEPVLIGRLHTDMDRGDGRTKYTLEGEGVGSVFVIDSNTGNIHVTKSLDREEKDQYRLTATATDRQTGRALEPSSQFIIRVQDINDNPPVFPGEPYIATVPEMANIGTSVIQVTAKDADDPTYGNSAQLVYAITEGQDYFSVDPQTGVLRTAMPNMDRETQEEYVVVLQARDMGGHLGGLSGTTTVTVRLSDVNDNPPHFRRSAWSFSVSELAAPGVEVGRLTATDADVGDNALLEFTIMDAEEAQTFNVSAREREAIIVLNKLLDYETRNSYSFTVEVANPLVDPRYLKLGPFKDQAMVRVMVLNADEPPRFSQTWYHLDVSENCPPVCSVGRVHAVDPDTGQSSNIRYSIDPQSDPEALFRIASDTGFISTVMELDREQEQWHNITVIATQRDNPNLVSRVVVAIETLDQNDNAPELDRQYTTSVCDSTAPGQVVQVLRAVDRDPGWQDAPVHFSIAPESSSALNLSIKDSGGATASLVLQSPLEPAPGYSSSLVSLYVPVVLRDGASGLANTATVTVTVCPCLRGGMRTEERSPRTRGRRWERRAVCRPSPSASPSVVFTLVILMAALACVTTLLVVCALSLSLRRQKRDAHSSSDDDDIRENIISYDDEGGGEADTAAFDMAALQSMHRIQHAHRNIWYTQQSAPTPRVRTYSVTPNPHPGPEPDRRPGSAPLYGRLCYGVHTLPVLRDYYYQAGPMQAGVRLPLAAKRQVAAPPVVGHQPVQQLPPEVGRARVLATQTLSRLMGRSEDGTKINVDANNQDCVKIDPAEVQSAPISGPASLSCSDPTGSSCQSPSSSSANQTLISTGATSCTVEDADTDCSLPSMSERSYPNAKLPVFPMTDTYSIVGSLNGTANATVLPRARTIPVDQQPLRMEDLLNFRLNRVTSDPSQPPYDSLQTYEFEGRDSRAESLSSLESEDGKDDDRDKDGKEPAAGGMEELNVKFQRLVELIRERKSRKEPEAGEPQAQIVQVQPQSGQVQEKVVQKWDF
ncbi:cadherin-24-like [Corythoichthys intestinalis]|uniref:cadherin-24-like n=1 Tax=Corythoichthys intestinalis TaxID=161448 RepID=UPI0025A5EE59|nr:cadherin-24-like [Corythoichthys intestinalis]XP_057697532.1 cadherin-24-like [Corythoichthys intestinalis]XP_057697533.1 cadherin-24-like [Corythoichthys intestinalis]